jgi:hypothetical protein
MKISVFKSLFNSKETPYTQDVVDVYNRIKEGYPELIDKITALRAMEDDNPAYSSLKNSLRAIMFNGTFNERNDNGLIEHSGLCILDFDDYPSDEVMEAEKIRLMACINVFMIFVSPSGKGLKCVIKIPPSDKFTHKRRFKAFEEYIDSDYFDTSSCNVSRVCFESYDPTAYINLDAELFNLIEEEKGHSSFDKVPVLPMTNESNIIDNIMKFNHGDLSNGRNNWVFKVASCFCEYGISENTAKLYLHQYSDKGFSQIEINTCVGSAYKRSDRGTKYFEDKETIIKVKSKLKEGISPSDISKQLDIKPDVVEDVKKDVANSEDVFWTFSDKKGVSVDPMKYRDFLYKYGFNKYYPERSEKPTFVRVIENKVNLSSVDQVKDFVLAYLMKQKQVEVWNYCSKSPYLFTDGHLSMLEPIGLMMLQDTKDVSFIPYRNGVVKITKDKIDIVPYIDIDGYIWDRQIIDRDYKPTKTIQNDFKSFVSKVSADDEQRVNALETTLGYLLHTYKDKTDQKAIIFNDQEIDDNPNGGSGKSLVLTAIGKIRNIVKIDGKAFNPQKSDFVYQRVNLDSQILAFDDVKKNFDFEQLFSLISEGITVNRKNKDEIFIPFERSPKIVITTNYVISGAGGSHDRRRHEIEFNQYFNAQRNPLDEYGRLLFDSWTVVDWLIFDNYMISNLQKFLSMGLVKAVAINANDKRFISSTNKEFYDYAIEGNITMDTLHYNNVSIQDFQTYTGGWHDLNAQRYLKMVNEYCKFKGYHFDKGRSAVGRWFKITKL